MKRKGFTLIELLIVVAIIAILAAIAVPNFLEAQIRSQVSRTMSDMRALATALESYRTDNQDYIQAYKQTIPGNQHWPSLGWLYAEWSNPNYDPRHVGFYLTTPIAYMTSIPLDQFTTKYNREHAVSVGSWGGALIASSVFYGMRYHAPLQVQMMDGNNVLADYFDVGYYMHSVGPDLQLHYGLPGYGQSGSNPNNPCPFQIISYDPSNGTVSVGEIVYIGTGVGFPGK